MCVKQQHRLLIWAASSATALVLLIGAASPSKDVSVRVSFDWLKCSAETAEVGLSASDEVFLSGAVFHSGTDQVQTVRWPKRKEYYDDVDAGEFVFEKPRELWAGTLAPGEFVSGIVTVQEQDDGKGPDVVAYELGLLATGQYGAALEMAWDAVEEVFSAGPNDTLGNFEFFVWNDDGSIRKELRALDYVFIQNQQWAMVLGGSFDEHPKSLIFILDGPGDDVEQYVAKFSIKSGDKRLRWTRDGATHAH